MKRRWRIENFMVDNSEEIGMVLIMWTMLTAVIWALAVDGMRMSMFWLLLPLYVGSAFYGSDRR